MSWRCNVHIENIVNNLVTISDGDINWTYYGDHFAVYKNIKSLCCIQKLLPLLWSLKVTRYGSHTKGKTPTAGSIQDKTSLVS